eukprot:jgi/Galph1/1850/GphlegSOOS_G541.1
MDISMGSRRRRNFRKGGNYSSDKLAEIERNLYQVSFGKNVSFYMVDQSQEDLSTTLFLRHSKDGWKGVDTDRIDYIAFFYRKPSFPVDSEYFVRALQSLQKSELPGFGIALSTCGCVVPKILLERLLQAELNGLECLTLPGFVVDKELVTWFESDETKEGAEPLSLYCQHSGILTKKVFPLLDLNLRQARLEFSKQYEVLALQKQRITVISHGKTPNVLWWKL